MNFDLANSLFELGGSILVWWSVYVLSKDKSVRGISKSQILFSAAWAVFCIPFYIHFGLYFSTACAAVRGVGSLTWSLLAIKYSTRGFKPAIVIPLHSRKKRRQ